jgi:amidase
VRSLILCTALLSVAAAPSPVRKIKSGETVALTTDAAAAVGPFWIEGAEPGDLVVVSITKLEPHGTTGTSSSVMAADTIDADSLANRQAPPVEWTINKAKGTVALDLRTAIPRVDWAARYNPPIYQLPLRPMLQSIGTAPGGKEAIAWQGAKVMLPVNEPGAMLSFGGGLARGGDGNVTGTGIETPLDVEFSAQVVKKKEWPHSSVARASTIAGEFELGWPRIETVDDLMAVGRAGTLDQALRHATTELHHWLDDDFGFSERSLSIFLGPTMQFEVVDAAGPSFVVIAKVKKSYLPKTTPSD